MLKSVEMRFEAADMTRADREAILDEQLESVRDDMLFLDRYSTWSRALPERLHDAYKEHLTTVVWPLKASYVLDFLSLDQLIIDFYHARCPKSDCHLRHLAVKALDRGFAKIVPKKLKLQGLDKAKKDALDVVQAWTARRLHGTPTHTDYDKMESIRSTLSPERILFFEVTL